MRRVLGVACAIGLSSVAAADVIDLYLFAGQSNMVGGNPVAQLADLQPGWQDAFPAVRHNYIVNGLTRPGGWGPLAPQAGVLPPGNGTWGSDLAFGRMIEQSHPDASHAVAKAAWNGTSLPFAWRPSVNDIYPLATTFLANAISELEAQGNTVRLRAVFWVHGYADSSIPARAEQYAESLTELMAALRTDFNTPELPLVFTRQHIGTLRDGLPAAALDILRAEQEAYAALDPNAYLIDIDDLTFRDNGVHYDSASTIEIARRMHGIYTTQIIPGPAAGVLLGLGVLTASRRRR